MKKLSVNLNTTDQGTILNINGDKNSLKKSVSLHYAILISIPSENKGEKDQQIVFLDFFISNFLSKKYELKYRVNNHKAQADKYIKNIVFNVDKNKDNYSLSCNITDDYFMFNKPSLGN